MALPRLVAITDVDGGADKTVETSAGLVAAAAPATVVVLTTLLSRLHLPLTKFTATQPSVVSHWTRHALMSDA